MSHLCGGWTWILGFKLCYELTDLCPCFTTDAQASICAIEGVEENSLNKRHMSKLRDRKTVITACLGADVMFVQFLGSTGCSHRRTT